MEKLESLLAQVERKRTQDLLFQLLLATDFLNKQWHLDNIELIVKLLDLVEVLLLHLPARIALLAWVVLLGE